MKTCRRRHMQRQRPASHPTSPRLHPAARQLRRAHVLLVPSVGLQRDRALQRRDRLVGRARLCQQRAQGLQHLQALPPQAIMSAQCSALSTVKRGAQLWRARQGSSATRDTAPEAGKPVSVVEARNACSAHLRGLLPGLAHAEEQTLCGRQSRHRVLARAGTKCLHISTLTNAGLPRLGSVPRSSPGSTHGYSGAGRRQMPTCGASCTAWRRYRRALSKSSMLSASWAASYSAAASTPCAPDASKLWLSCAGQRKSLSVSGASVQLSWNAKDTIPWAQPWACGSVWAWWAGYVRCGPPWA